MTKSAPLEVHHPALPPPVWPVAIDPIIITPEIAEIWNTEVAEGKRMPYTVFGFDEQTWLTFGQYQEEIFAYVQKLLSIIEQYGHPALQTSATE